MCTAPTDAELAAAFDAHADESLAIANGTAVLAWHYGPTEADAEPGRMWCYSCGAEVIADDYGYWCTGCHAESKE